MKNGTSICILDYKKLEVVTKTFVCHLQEHYSIYNFYNFYNSLSYRSRLFVVFCVVTLTTLLGI